MSSNAQGGLLLRLVGRSLAHRKNGIESNVTEMGLSTRYHELKHQIPPREKGKHIGTLYSRRTLPSAAQNSVSPYLKRHSVSLTADYVGEHCENYLPLDS